MRAQAVLKRIRDDGWYFVCRLKQNRRFNGQAVRAYRRHPSGADIGRLTGGRKVLVVSYGATYDATKRLTLPAAAVRRRYGIRAQIETALAQLKTTMQMEVLHCKTGSSSASVKRPLGWRSSRES